MKEIRALRAEEIECRAQMVKEKGCALLLYKDARCDMRILDEVFGPMNWERKHEAINDNLFCRVGIWDAEKKEWVWKEDAGSPSITEANKGHSSDAFKRACFNWGIGRELYTAPFIWVNLGEGEAYLNDKKKWQLSPKLKLHVKTIAYQDGKISDLEIVDQTGKMRYKMSAQMPKQADYQKSPPKKDEKPPHPKALKLNEAAKGNRGLVLESLGAWGYEKAAEVPDDVFPQLIADIQMKAS